MRWRRVSPTASGVVGLVALMVLATIPGAHPQTAGDVVRIEICQPNRRLPSYMQDACDELLASQGTAQSGMADSGTGASPPDRRPLSDPPRYGRRSGGSPLSVHVSKRLYSQPTFKLYNVMNRQLGGGRRSQGHQVLLKRSLNFLRRISSLNDQFALLEDM